jgi:mannose-6-phosphate isomerase-like protein (cupin superfamily)
MNFRTLSFSLALFFSALIGSNAAMASETSTADKDITSPGVTEQIIDKAKANDNWKVAFLTGKHGQIVFMSVSPTTNPNNEIGMEVHPFDQVIIVAEGDAKAILGNKTSMVKAGDMIFIPQGTPHNVINLTQGKALKIISFYSNTDIPAKSVYKTKSDEAKQTH